MEKDKKKYFIVGTGRCGTSMLSAIVDHCGGKFGSVKRKDSSLKRGYFESSRMFKAYRWYKRARYPESPAIPYPHFIKNFAKDRGDELLKQELAEANWLKFPHFHEYIAEVKRLGFEPVIIGMWRDLWPTAMSYHTRRMTSADEEIKRWVDTNTNLIFLLKMYDGCLIKFEDLLDFSSSKWAESLSGVCDFSKDALLNARKELMDEREHNASPLDLDFLPEHIAKLHEKLAAESAKKVC